MSTSCAGISRPDFQAFNGRRSIGGTRKVRPVLSQGFVFERLQNGSVEMDGNMMTVTEMTGGGSPWEGIVAGQTNDGAILRFGSKQRTILQDKIWKGGVIHVEMEKLNGEGCGV